MNTPYNIVLYTLDRNNDKLLINVLVQHYQRIAIVEKITDISQHLKEETPKIILVSAEKFQDTLSNFYSALDKVDDNQLCDHYFVSLISKRDETQAYEAYRSGIIDDYIVSRPLYEMHRPIVICDHLLVELGVAKDEKAGLEHLYKQDKYSDQVRRVVARGLERKEMLRADFESSLTLIENSLDGAAEQIQKNQSVELDLEQLKLTLATIKSDQIRPELLKLQSKALSLLEKVVGDVNEMVKQNASSKQSDETSNVSSTITYNNLQETHADVDELLAKANKTLRILLVEDDPISMHLTTQLMLPYKIELETAFTGRRALACINEHTFDVIFMDITLPDTNGLYILDQITNMKNKQSNTIVIMLTGNKNKATAMKAIKMGARGYIVKPLHKENFINIFTKFKLPLQKNRSSKEMLIC